jgi:hypothetical protein
MVFTWDEMINPGMKLTIAVVKLSYRQFGGYLWMYWVESSLPLVSQPALD